MKKTLRNKIKIFLVFALIATLIMLLISCRRNDPINKDLEAQILNDFLIYRGMIGDIFVEELKYTCFGQYGDSIAIYFHNVGAYDTKSKIEISGCSFKYPDSREILIWSDGNFYNMLEAYEKELISDYDINSIHKKTFLFIHQKPLFYYEDKQVSYMPDIEYTSEFGNGVIYGGLGVMIDPHISKGDIYSKFSENSKFWGSLNIDGVGLDELDEQGHAILYLALPFVVYPELEDYMYRLGYYKSELEKIEGVTKVWVELAETVLDTANDTYYNNTSIAYPLKNALDQIHVPKVWDFTTGSSAISVGVVDTGIASHEYFIKIYAILKENFFEL